MCWVIDMPHLLVAAGDGWALWWPVEAWFSLSAEEQVAIATRQAKLLENPQLESGSLERTHFERSSISKIGDLMTKKQQSSNRMAQPETKPHV